MRSARNAARTSTSASNARRAKDKGVVWSTPMPGTSNSLPVIVGHILRLSDGKILQQGLHRLTYNSPILDGDAVYFFQIPGTASLCGQVFKLPAQAADPLQLKPAWQARDERFYGSPVFHEGLLYCANQLDTLVCADAVNGQVFYSKKLGLGGQIFSSACFASGNIYITSDSGNTVVVKPGRTYEEVARNSLGEVVRSTPVFAGNRMYVRGYKNLWCIGQ